MSRTTAASDPVRHALLATAGVTLLLLLPVPLALADFGRGELFAIGKDKIAHLLLFVPLTWAWLEAVRVGIEAGRRGARGPVSPRGAALFAALVAWGGAIELAQAWTGWRSGEWSDLVADALGVAAGFAAHAWRHRTP